MAVWFIDGFDHYCDYPFAVPPAASTSDLLRKWSSTTASGVIISPGHARQQPGQGLRLGPTLVLSKIRPGALTDTYIIGFAFQTNLVNVAGKILDFMDTTTQCDVRMDATGHITFTRNGTVLATSTNTLSSNNWYYLEAKVKIHNSTGTYEVRINGSATNWIPAATGQNTRTTANNQLTGFQIGASGTNVILYFDDLYAADATGAANTDFLGPQTVVALRPAAAGNYAQFTPNYGTNFGNVGENYPDGDASFNASVTAGHRDSFALTDVPFSSGTIAAIQHVIYAKQDAGAQRVIKPMQRTATTDRDGTAVNLSASYQMITEVMNVNPADSAAYDIADLNADEFGYTLVS